MTSRSDLKIDQADRSCIEMHFAILYVYKNVNFQQGLWVCVILATIIS